MKKGKKKNIIIENICSLFYKLRVTISSSVMRMVDKLRFNVNKTDDYGYVSLGPTNDAQNVSEYMRAMEWAIKDKNVTNIAIAGPYGAGKSSIIETFLRKHSSIKYINISLATFGKDSQKKADMPEEFEKQLEEGILKQLFYKVHYSKIPQSRYRKLHKVSFRTSFARVVFTLIFIISAMFLFAPAKLEKLAKTYSDEMGKLFGWNQLYQILFATGFTTIIMFTMAIFFRWVNTKWKSIEINVADKAVVKADEKVDEVSLNKNMDEILYFFEETDYTLVVIEDVDRFDTPEVYTKLREINKIINDYDAIRRRIVFVYALKDDMFTNENRTKFFDFIIPVVPYVDSTNSGEYLRRRLETLKNTEIDFDISNDYIVNVSPFISDMRVLNNICNEFVVFKKTIKDSQELNKLKDEQMISIMIFKNTYSEEFVNLQKSEGLIKRAYSNRSNFIKNKSVELQNEIESAEEEKKKSDSQGLLDVETIKLAFIQKLVGDKGIFKKIQGTKGTYTKSEILKDDFSLSQIGNGDVTVYYQAINNYGDKTESKKNIENLKCSDGMSYFLKCDRAIAQDKKYRKQITQNLLDKQKKLYALRSKSMKVLIKEYGANNVLDEEVTKNSLLTFLLRHGYIDDTYQMYINYFLPGSITVDEQNFILNVRNYAGNSGWDYKIIHPENVVERLFDYELEQQKECLNFDLAEYFYENKTESDKKLGFTKQLAKDDEESKRFIKEYYVRSQHKDEYIKSIAHQKPLFWFDICSDDTLGYQDKVVYLKDIFMYLDPEDIVLQDTAANDKNSGYSICTFIVESEKALEQLQDAGVEKIVTVLIRIKAKFKNINLGTVDSEIVRGIYKNELFEISFVMLQKYVDFRAGEAVAYFGKNIYTYILRQKDDLLIEYVENNINEFVTEVILGTDSNTKEDIDTICRCIRLLDYDEEISISLIQKMDAVMDDLNRWFSSMSNQRKDIRNIVDTFLSENKMAATIKNLDAYKSKYQFSVPLCGFIDKNIDTLLLDANFDDTHARDFLKKEIKDLTIKKILQNYKIDSFNESLNSYADNVVKAMIEQRYFKYTRKRYDEILTTFPKLLPIFAENYWEEFEQDISNINFEITTLNIFFESEINDEKKVVFLNRANPEQITEEMVDFVRNTDVNVPKKYLQTAWKKIEIMERPTFMVEHFRIFNINEIQGMFLQMPNEYHALKQEDKRHEVLLEKNPVNDKLCQKLLEAGYISSYVIKKSKSVLLAENIEKFVVRVKAKK